MVFGVCQHIIAAPTGRNFMKFNIGECYGNLSGKSEVFFFAIGGGAGNRGIYMVRFIVFGHIDSPEKRFYATYIVSDVLVNSTQRIVTFPLLQW
jgi:hypothetical protein